MTTLTHCHMEGAVDSLLAYIDDGTFGINTVLAEMRAEYAPALDTDDLPNIAQTAANQSLVDKLPSLFVYATDFRDATGEALGTFAPVGRRYGEVDLTITVYVGGADVTHGAARTQEAVVQVLAMRYAAALYRLLMAPFGLGQSMNQGSGRGAGGKILNVFDIQQSIEAVVSTDGRPVAPNRTVVTTCTAKTSEE